MSLSIRLACVADAPRLPAIERSAAQAFTHHQGLEWIAQGRVMSTAEHLVFIEQGHEWVLIDAHDLPQGFLCAEPAGGDLFIRELSVHHQAQGQGHGRRLIARVSQWASEQGFAALTLTTFVEVPWNAPFYARLGFQMLDDQHLTNSLHQQLLHEQHQGRPARCAMRLSLQHLR